MTGSLADVSRQHPFSDAPKPSGEPQRFVPSRVLRERRGPVQGSTELRFIAPPKAA